MDWTALVLVSIPLAGAALYIAFHFLKQMCKRPGYTQIVTPASSQIQICEQGGGESVGSVGGQGLQARKGTAENGGWYQQQQQQRKQQQQEERRERRRKPTFVKLLRPLPVKPVCTSDQLKVKTRQTIHISKESKGQNIPQLAAPQREGEQQQGEEEDEETQDLCPVCQLPLPECRQENRTSSFPQGSWSGREQLQSSGRAHLPPSCPHCDRYEDHPCNHHLLPLPSTSAASNQQVICPDCWPLVGSYLMKFYLFFSFQALLPFRSWRW